MFPRSMLVGAYPSSLEAGLAQGLLQQEGIASELDGLTSQSWLAGEVPLTGFRLLVAREDLSRAREVLAEVEGKQRADVEGDDPSLGADERALTPASRGSRSATAAGATMLLGVLILGPITLSVAAVWAFTLLRSPAGRAMSRGARVLLGVAACLAALTTAGLLALGWPFELLDDIRSFSVWGYIGVDAAFAVGACAAWRTSWPHAERQPR